MRRSNFSLRLAPSMFEETRKVARSEGIAMNQFIMLAVTEKVTTLRTEDYFKERAERADVPKALRLLKRAGAKNLPMEGDEIL
jgi:hypothetical protein